MRPRKLDLFQGTLDMFLLASLTPGARHGYQMLRWIRDVTGGELEIEEGALYPALHRLEARGAVVSEQGLSDHGRHALFCRLTPAGREELAIMVARWHRYVAAAAKILAGEIQPPVSPQGPALIAPEPPPR